jgi:hypothetical protein
VSHNTSKLAIPPAVLLSTLITLVLLALPLKSSPQAPAAKQDYALIFGTVWGPDSRPVAGVPIRIRRASEKKFRWELTSNRRGEFAQRVPVGAQDYVIQADTKTPKGTSKAEITVHIDDNEREDVGIHLTEQQLPRSE